MRDLNAVSDGFRVLQTIGYEFMRARSATNRTRRPAVEQQVPSTYAGAGVPPVL